MKGGQEGIAKIYDLLPLLPPFPIGGATTLPLPGNFELLPKMPLLFSLVSSDLYQDRVRRLPSPRKRILFFDDRVLSVVLRVHYRLYDSQDRRRDHKWVRDTETPFH